MSCGFGGAIRYWSRSNAGKIASTVADDRSGDDTGAISVCSCAQTSRAGFISRRGAGGVSSDERVRRSAVRYGIGASRSDTQGWVSADAGCFRNVDGTPGCCGNGAIGRNNRAGGGASLISSNGVSLTIDVYHTLGPVSRCLC